MEQELIQAFSVRTVAPISTQCAGRWHVAHSSLAAFLNSSSVIHRPLAFSAALHCTYSDRKICLYKQTKKSVQQIQDSCLPITFNTNFQWYYTWTSSHDLLIDNLRYRNCAIVKPHDVEKSRLLYNIATSKGKRLCYYVHPRKRTYHFFSFYIFATSGLCHLPVAWWLDLLVT